MRLSISPVSLTLVALVVYLAAPAPSVNAQPDIPVDGPLSFVSFDHHRVVRVNIKNEEHLKTLIEHEESLQFDYFTFQKTVGGHVDIRIAPENYAKFQELQLDYEMLIDNLQTLIDREREENERYQQEWEMMNQNKVSQQ
ncbi:MAG: hypothetical protein J3Q66DRAFT_358844 [Benniella sp.]|nr:MAG: hypothetical protein J3Q66DRAFT_358844 [Benniella sp.]